MATHAGIDLGTSGVKTVLIDHSGAVIADAQAPLSVQRPHPGWSEQDPGAWWDAAAGTLDALARDHPAAMAALAGIGLSGQMHGATLLGADHRVLRPCILWNDGRSAAEAAALERVADFHGIGANLVMPGFTAPKLAWVRAHEPEIFAATRLVLLPKDWLRLCLTGEAVSDMSDAAGTLWLDVAGRRWSPALLAACGLSDAEMPRLVEGTAASGTLLPALCARWGIAGRPVVAGGGGDNAASACAVGAVRPGEGFLSLGTSGVIFVATAACRPNVAGAVHMFCHAVPGTWHQMAVILSAADSLSWLAEVTGQAPDRLTALAEAAPETDALFLPYLSGERTPHNDAGARGAFVGLDRAADAGILARAVLTGVAFALADGADALRAAGTAIGPLYALGGGARSPFWLQRIADATGITLRVAEGAALGGALGAARLGQCAAGATVGAAMTPPAVAHEIMPDAAATARLAPARARFRRLYPALRDALA